MTWTLLISLLIKSSLIAGVGLAASRHLTQRPIERVDILRGTVCLLLALPVIMNALPPIELALLPPLTQTAALAAPAIAPLAPPPSNAAWATPGAILGGVWLLGAALIGGRLALGLRTLTRWTRKADPVSCPAWLAPIEDLPPADRPNLACSERVAGPLSWGVAPGAILIDPATLAERHTAPAIMAHELAHLRRHDWIFLLISRVVLAIFWFNPLIWRLHAALRQRSEEAADAAALGFVDRALYARTLVRLASHPTPLLMPVASLPMAADSRTLKSRIACIMTDTPARRRPLTVALSIGALALVAAPLAAFAVTRQIAPPVPPVPPAPVASAPLSPAPPAPPALVAPLASVAPAAPPSPPAPPAPDADGYDLIQARAQAEWARAQADAVRVNAEEIRRQVEAHRDEIEAAAREARAQARVYAQQARLSAEEARRIGEEARKAGEIARVAAMKQARIDMARGADQMRAGARQMREEAQRLRDPAYRAQQIAENRARGQTVTDEELKALCRRLPGEADNLDREADRLAQRAREVS
ncbi:beta-lactamase regulating signal transducer with metallopeptidase domain [Caulobacter sp. BE264]|uniref:M56 family metallopeptidase n=1 Tax=Caulobacter sp. BE264 TaxID=2817724 RepID=UPI0028664FA5|nr:M56 family metallopeptidase [Caulobacter sp. BE264]MDR7232125.1 beta-lactamase regulating signal transducer with metallopeptidase domain [Caulobacter sp. BE264]